MGLQRKIILKKEISDNIPFMIKVLDLSQSSIWNKFLAEVPHSNLDIYFTPEYYSLYESNGDGLARCFVFQNEMGIALYPFLLNEVPKHFNLSKTYYDIQGAYGYNGIIFSNESKEFIDLFYLNFNEFCIQNNIIAEFTRFHPVLKNQTFSEGNMDILMDRKVVSLDLQNSIEKIWTDSYSSNNRNMIRKAQKNGVEVLVSEEETDYDAFFHIYTETMENVQASQFYFFDRGYIDDFKIKLKDNHKLLVAKFEGQVICAMLMMYKGDYAHYHLSGRKKEFSKLAANNLMLHKAIETAKELGCKHFHFGGGTSSAEDDFLFKFKSNFSKNILDFKIGKKVHFPEIYTEVVLNWEQNNPDKSDSKLLLKYRE